MSMRIAGVPHIYPKTLFDHLRVIPKSKIVSTLHAMLDRSHQIRTLNGKRVVSIDGYEGSVRTDELAKLVFKAARCTSQPPSWSHERSECDRLWERMKALLETSDAEEDSQAERTIKDPNSLLRARILSFEPELFKRLWPNSKPTKTFDELIRDSLSGTERVQTFWCVAREDLMRCKGSTS